MVPILGGGALAEGIGPNMLRPGLGGGIGGGAFGGSNMIQGRARAGGSGALGLPLLGMVDVAAIDTWR